MYLRFLILLSKQGCIFKYIAMNHNCFVRILMLIFPTPMRFGLSKHCKKPTDQESFIKYHNHWRQGWEFCHATID